MNATWNRKNIIKFHRETLRDNLLNIWLYFNLSVGIFNLILLFVTFIFFNASMNYAVSFIRGCFSFFKFRFTLSRITLFSIRLRASLLRRLREVRKSECGFVRMNQFLTNCHCGSRSKRPVCSCELHSYCFTV